MGEFGVYSIEGTGSVVGRCYRGVLQAGSIFLSVTGPDGVSRPVRLAIARIEAYQQDFEQIEEGLTARLYLHGEGWAFLHKETILNTEQEPSDMREEGIDHVVE